MNAVSYNRRQKINQRDTSKRPPKKIFWALGGFFLFLAGLVYLLFYSSFFEVRATSFKISDGLPELEIKEKVNTWLDFKILNINRRSNYLIFRPQKMASLLISDFSAIDTVAITRDSHEININITKRKPVGIWCLVKQNDCFFFDKEGKAYEKTGRTEGFIYAVITDNRERSLKLGNEIESNQWRERIFSIKNFLKRNDFEASEFVLPSDTYDEFYIKTMATNDTGRKSWNIMMSTSLDPEQQLAAFINLYNKKMTPDEKDKLEYVDLRIADRIYYK